MKERLDPAYKTGEYTKLLIILAFIWLCFSPVFLFSLETSLVFLILLFPSITSLLITVPFLLWLPRFYRSFSYALEGDIVRIHKGVVTKNEVSIPYSRIQDVKIVRGPIQRGLGIATIKIQTAGSAYSASGETAEGIIPGIRDPERAIKTIMNKVKGMKSGAGGLAGEKDTQVLILEELKKISRKLK